MTFLSFSLAFGLLAVLRGILDSKFKLSVFCCQCTHQGEDCEIKWLVLWFDCDELLICHSLNLNPGHFCSSTTIYLMWRIVFACLVMCR
jgi:hypothetical protein